MVRVLVLVSLLVLVACSEGSSSSSAPIDSSVSLSADGQQFCAFANGPYTDAFSDIAPPVTASSAVPRMRDVAQQTRELYGTSDDPTIASIATEMATSLDGFADSIEANGGQFDPAIMDGGLDGITDASMAVGDYCA